MHPQYPTTLLVSKKILYCIILLLLNIYKEVPAEDLKVAYFPLKWSSMQTVSVKFEICMPEIYEIEWKYIEINTQKIYKNCAPDISSTQYGLYTLGSQGMHNLGLGGGKKWRG